MSDIVNELRDLNGTEPTPTVSALVLRAADEIDRLNALVVSMQVNFDGLAQERDQMQISLADANGQLAETREIIKNILDRIRREDRK